MPKFTAFFTAEDRTKPLNILHDIISKFDQVPPVPHSRLKFPPKNSQKYALYESRQTDRLKFPSSS